MSGRGSPLKIHETRGNLSPSSSLVNAASTTGPGQATVAQYASIVAKQRAGIGKNLDDMMSSNCDWTMPGSVDTRPGYKTCAIQVFTINLKAHSLQMVLQGAQNPEGPASIGAPPDEIKSLVADTITAARTLESESDKANPCTAPGASADCVTILFDFARAMTAMQAQFAAWSPYGG